MLAITSVLTTLFMVAPGAAHPPASIDAVNVRISNPLPAPRPLDTVVLAVPELARIAPGLDPKTTVVVDSAGALVESQFVDLDGDGRPEQLVFQSTFAAGESRGFLVRPGDRRPPTRDAFRVYGRFVRERHDDFAWENDRVAHRMYGTALETWKAEPLVSSGVDVWCKRVPRLVINDWYLTDDYHQDSGEGADLYSVGKSRGCGGTAVWAGDKGHPSRNFVSSRVLASGPIRLVFELDYAPWRVPGAGAGPVQTVSETKRITLDAGSNFNRFDITLKVSGSPAPSQTVAVGISRHEGGVAQVNQTGGWMHSWEPLKNGNGNLGCALVLPPGALVEAKATESDHLLIARARGGTSLTYHAGSAWDRGGQVTDQGTWAALVARFARDVAAPLRVSLSAVKVAPADASPAAPPDGSTPQSQTSWSRRTCDSVMAAGPTLTETWHYDAGLVLQGCWRVAAAAQGAARETYASYVKRSIDHLLDERGAIKGYRPEDYNLDNINMGKLLFPLLAGSTDPREQERYRSALKVLRSQLETQPRTREGGFWHKQIYPRQMWLDGIYMASPFLAQFAVVFNEPALLDDAARQVLLAEKHLRDGKTGLLFHGWDESKEQRWADPRTGRSSQFWARAMGWYAMGVVDVLEFMPPGHRQRQPVIAVLRRLATAIASVQDRSTGVWWQVLDAPGRGKNYREASASAMFVYALSKGIKNGWLDARRFGPVAARGLQGLLATFAEATPAGRVNVTNICKVAGLGGNPYRDGSFDYYTSTEVVTNDFKGVGAFILATAINE